MVTKRGVVKKFGSYSKKPLFKDIKPRGKTFTIVNKVKGVVYFYLTKFKI